ncbi:DgyrCDS14501 [Dimorphilus gyrociliatus]|uniref:DgyrCDS14501 n=1 Tax=Dimorphilus gyrociliatus TaxID=2664684 RepID=A0A7I8WDV1_9ANNE|nr:DgyrCDS14501 [Dimorphilus gyrociliatus]
MLFILLENRKVESSHIIDNDVLSNQWHKAFILDLPNENFKIIIKITRGLLQSEYIALNEMEFLAKEQCLHGIQKNKKEKKNSNRQLLNVSCGRISSVSKYIVGGKRVNIEEIPWQGIILRNLTYICGAVLISEKYALTAAHCLQGSTEFYAVFGTGDKRQIADKIKINKFYINPKYDGRQHDIAIFRLSSYVKFSERIFPICLPESDNVEYLNIPCQTSGFDETNYLWRVEQRLMTEQSCNKKYPIVVKSVSYPQNICAESVNYPGNSCHGDSGGPLFCYIDDYWTIVGIVNGGDSLCKKKLTYSARVSTYHHWIRDVLVKDKNL